MPIAKRSAPTCEVIVFDRVEADPSKETLLSATETGRAAGVTSVVGFGGGSPMDVAKLAAYLLGSGDELDEIWGVGIATGKRLPLALVPTTAGTGSEATPISVITCEGGVKLAVNSPPLIADWAVLDATLTLGAAATRDARRPASTRSSTRSRRTPRRGSRTRCRTRWRAKRCGC